MKILIVDQCSSDKDYPEQFSPFDAETIDTTSRENLLDRNTTPEKRARKLYQGRQQTYISRAADTLRAAGDTVDRYFISAGFGLVEEDEYLPPYDVTFADYTTEEIEKRATKLAIQDDVSELIANEYDVIFFALGNDYYQSINFEEVLKSVSDNSWIVTFNQESLSNKIETVISLPARTEQAKQHNTIVVALKGVYIQNFAEYRSHGKEVENSSDLEKYCTSEYTTQSGLDQYGE